MAAILKFVYIMIIYLFVLLVVIEGYCMLFFSSPQILFFILYTIFHPFSLTLFFLAYIIAFQECKVDADCPTVCTLPGCPDICTFPDVPTCIDNNCFCT